MSQLLATPEGDSGPCTPRLFEAAYRELRSLAASLMRNERHDHTLQPTALVNEAFLRLAGDPQVEWRSRAHFFSIVVTAMRRVLVEHARRRSTSKRGGGWTKIAFDEQLRLTDRFEFDILELDRALSEFAEVDARAARVVELHIFGGLREKEIARILEVSERTIRGDWRVALMWLRRALGTAASP